jgi:WD40 repeat protein
VNTDIPTMIARKLVKFHSAEIYDIALNLNGSLIATCGGDRYVRVYDPLNLQNVSQFQSTGDEVLTSLCFSPSFECLLMGSTDSTAQLWQVSGWKLKARFLGHSDQVTAVGFIGAEKDTCISGSNDRQIKLWNVNTGACIKTVNTGSMVTSLACQHNVPFVITAHKDGSIRGYTLKQDSKPSFHHKNLFDDSITSISLSQDNNSALLCSKEGSAVKIYDLRMNKVVN